MDYSRIFTLWTIPEVLHSGPFQQFNILDQSIPFKNFHNIHWSMIFTFGPFKNFPIYQHSRNWIFLNILEFLCFFFLLFQNLYILGHSRFFISLTTPEIVYVKPLQNFYMMDQFRNFTFLTITGFSNHGLFQNL